ncbi:unnamed protein product [Paramecium pentaurelia]|uniref:Uncharacterized protein n=1 Tax=Paramecium pentaurelia TaxID=43138 RepID=A0A8S1WUV2_9CILI|nr:unnamed protein product [Paramecium pentaurelia]
MLTIRNEGPFLVQELDVSLQQDNNNAIVIDESDLVILIPDEQKTKKRKQNLSRQNKKKQNKVQSFKKSNTNLISNKKEKKQQKFNNIHCKNKFFKDINMQCSQIIQNNDLNNCPLKFCTNQDKVSNESKAFQSMMENVQKYKEQVSWSNKKDHIQIPDKLLKDEIQDIQLFVPQIKGINDSICSNTLYLNKIKDKILHVSSPTQNTQNIKYPKDISRDAYIEYLKNIQMNRVISQNKQLP